MLYKRSDFKSDTRYELVFKGSQLYVLRNTVSGEEQLCSASLFDRFYVEDRPKRKVWVNLYRHHGDIITGGIIYHDEKDANACVMINSSCHQFLKTVELEIPA